MHSFHCKQINERQNILREYESWMYPANRVKLKFNMNVIHWQTWYFDNMTRIIQLGTSTPVQVWEVQTAYKTKCGSERSAIVLTCSLNAMWTITGKTVPYITFGPFETTGIISLEDTLNHSDLRCDRSYTVTVVKLSMQHKWECFLDTKQFHDSKLIKTNCT